VAPSFNQPHSLSRTKFAICFFGFGSAGIPAGVFAVLIAPIYSKASLCPITRIYIPLWNNTYLTIVNVLMAEGYRELYRAVKEFTRDQPIAKDQLQLNFEVSIIDVGFESLFFEKINQGVVGSFCGIEDGRNRLRSMLKKYDFNNWEHLENFLDELVEHLQAGKRPANPKAVSITEQLKKDHSVPELYDYIFSLSYLSPRYTLKLGTKELAQLSPGEKGALLLIFYLLVDRGQVPLVIDQPEGNLDNETMYKLLVPCLKEPRRKGK
jgi:hypothetical protein